MSLRLHAHDLGLTWVMEEPLERASHALVHDGRVWFVDPVGHRLDDAGDRGQHRSFGICVRNPKLQRHRALVALSKRNVHVREGLWIAQRVLDRGHNPHHPHGLPDFWSWSVEELNQPTECVLAWPESLCEHVVDDRDTLRGAG